MFTAVPCVRVFAMRCRLRQDAIATLSQSIERHLSLFPGFINFNASNKGNVLIHIAVFDNPLRQKQTEDFYQSYLANTYTTPNCFDTDLIKSEAVVRMAVVDSW